MTTSRTGGPYEGFSGAVLVSRGGSVLLRAAYGTADAEAGEPCTPRTRFQIASVSKQFTAILVLSLAEEGVLGLHTPVRRWMPELPYAWRKLTLHQLLTHTAGLGHWFAVPGWDIDRPGAPDDVLRRAATVPLLAEPGTAWHYSSPGYLLAARTVERITGVPHARALHERIFRPLGMADTLAGRTPADRFARGHLAGRRADAAEFADLPGAGDIWSTVDDLARYAAALDAGEILSAGSRALLRTAHARPPAGPLRDHGALTGPAYGYGLFLGTFAGRRAHYHPGDNPGFQSVLVRQADQDTTVVVLANDEESDLKAVLRDIAHPLVAQAGGGGPSTSARS